MSTCCATVRLMFYFFKIFVYHLMVETQLVRKSVMNSIHTVTSFSVNFITTSCFLLVR